MAVAVEDLGPAPVGGRPSLRLVGPGRSTSRGAVRAARVSARVRARRRALTVAASVAAGLCLALPIPALAGRTVATPTPSAVAASSSLPVHVQAGQGVFYVVRPGDTLRSIASRLAPHDVEATETSLVRELGTSHVVPGEHISLP